ncbi:hypothetical protein B0J17DRAFT_350245 [Rhizoctonia solani]|nr:hypothetical protein B0J17DRAFT_350245 [Rhizoctonia solani]
MAMLSPFITCFLPLTQKLPCWGIVFFRPMSFRSPRWLMLGEQRQYRAAPTRPFIIASSSPHSPTVTCVGSNNRVTFSIVFRMFDMFLML